MKSTRRVAAGLMFLLVFSSAGLAEDAPGEGKEWRQLFNGKDLKDWKIKIKGYELGDNYGDTFRVEDGLLKVSYDQYQEFGGRFGHIFFKEEFSNYRLRAEYRFVGEQVKGGPGWAFRNNGLMLHGQLPETMAVVQDFPASIEVQLLGGRGTGERTTANLCTPGTNVVMDGKLIRRHCTDSTSKTYHGDQWVTVEIEVLGNSVKHIIDGEVVLAYTDPQLDENDADAKKLLESGEDKMLRRGTISLQAESHPTEFRKIEILELDAPAATSTADSADGWVDLLAGNDLAKHWTTTGNWKIDSEGVVTLTPRPGESGWSRWDAYLWLAGQYRDFEIEFDYKVQKGGNSGFYFHVGDKNDPVAKGIEVQIYESHAKGKDARLTDHDSGGIIPGVPPKKNTAKPAGEWNRFHITVKGLDLTVKLNGVVVNEMKLDHPNVKNRPATGFIGFQDHGLPLGLRKIRIKKT